MSTWNCCGGRASELHGKGYVADRDAADTLAFSVIGVLVDYSLAKRTPAGLHLHRLV